MSKISDEEAKKLARLVTSLCVRDNTSLENFHAGTFPETVTGDYSDVKVVDGKGQEIPWCDVSRIDDVEMKVFIKEIVNNLYTCLAHCDNPDIREVLRMEENVLKKWDDPEANENFFVSKLRQKILGEWGV